MTTKIGGRKKPLHECTAEFTELVVKKMERRNSADTSGEGTLDCEASELPIKARGDRIQEHLDSHRHERNRSLLMQSSVQNPVPISSASLLTATGLPVQPSQRPVSPQRSDILFSNDTVMPSPPADHATLLPGPSSDGHASRLQRPSSAGHESLLPGPSSHGHASLLPGPSSHGQASLLPGPSSHGHASRLPGPSSHGHASLLPGPSSHGHASLLPGPSTHGHASLLAGPSTHGHASLLPGPSSQGHASLLPGPSSHGHASMLPGPSSHGHAFLLPGPSSHGHTCMLPGPSSHGQACVLLRPSSAGHASLLPGPSSHDHASLVPGPSSHGQASLLPGPSSHGHASLLPGPSSHGQAFLLPGPSSHGHASPLPGPSSHGHASLLPGPSSAVLTSPTSNVPAREGQMPSTSAGQLAALPALQVYMPWVPSYPANQIPRWEVSNTMAQGGGPRWPHVRAWSSGCIGLSVFGMRYASKALLQSLMDETGCCLLYIVEDKRSEVKRAFRADRLYNTQVVSERDGALAILDQRVSGVVVCSPPEAAYQIVMFALQAGKGVLCEGLPSLDRQTVEACFDEADRRGRPLVFGFYKRFDPDLQFLKENACDRRTLGRLHGVNIISRVYPAPSPCLLKKLGGIFYSVALHDIDLVNILLGERPPNSVVALRSAFCPDMTFLEEADDVMITIEFPSGALAVLDVSQHCTTSYHQALQVRGSRGTLQMNNQQLRCVSCQCPSVALNAQSHAARYEEAYRQLLRHFLRTLQGKEPPAVSRQQLLRALQIAADAERFWMGQANDYQR